MVLDVGLVLEQHQRLDDEALDQLGSPVVTNRQDRLVGEHVSGSARVAQPVSQRVLERMRPKQFVYEGIASEIHRCGVRASSGAGRFRSSPRVALAPPVRPPVVHVVCHRVGAFLSGLGVDAETNTARTRAINQIGTR